MASARRLSQVKNWIGFICLLTIGMVVLGGITRLTGSGLSIVEWKPLMGAIPPLTDEHWLDVFGRYQQYPEFKIRNSEMTLEEFKTIFYWEYFHRLLGRVIGLVFLIPLVYFAVTKAIRGRLLVQCMGAFLLGGLQGALGWYMVKSGLTDIPRVSHFRLAAHLVTAFMIISYLFWLYLDLKRGHTRRQPRRGDSIIFYTISALYLLLLFQFIYGAFMAKLGGGYIYNTFPKMGENWIPPEAFISRPIIYDITNNVVSVQFLHRGLGWVLFGIGIYFSFYIFRKSKGTTQKNAALYFAGVLALQFFLGIMTLLFSVPILLGVAHQLGACILLLSIVNLSHSLLSDRDFL